MTVQCAQLNEANRLWQQYQENQSMILRDRLHLSPTDDLSFEQIVQAIAERLDQKPLEGIERDYQVELTQLREELTTRTAQCKQLSEVNQAWSQFQQAQLELMRNKLEEKLPIDPSLSLDQVAQRIVDHLTEQEQLVKHANTVQQKRDIPILDHNSTDRSDGKESTADGSSDLRFRLFDIFFLVRLF